MRELPPFEVNYDYLCPFAHIAHEHLVAGLRHGAPWQVTFTPWTLRQVHREEGAPDVWTDPQRREDLLALAASLVVRDHFSDHFLDAHVALFRARHDRSLSLRTREEVGGVLAEAGVDADKVLELVDAGAPYDQLGEDFQRLATGHDVFGVPTFVVGGDAVFVRLMARPVDGDDAVGAIEQVLDLLVDDPRLNEFKRTRIPR